VQLRQRIREAYFCRESERAIARWEEWMQLREQARENYEKSGSTQPMPKALTEDPPPKPEPYQDEDLTDVSVDITANGFDASESFTLDRSLAEEVVPASDPGVDRIMVSGSIVPDSSQLTM
jgi:serine/threonine-protein phosphatase 2A regulatory subunit B'